MDNQIWDSLSPEIKTLFLKALKNAYTGGGGNRVILVDQSGNFMTGDTEFTSNYVGKLTGGNGDFIISRSANTDIDIDSFPVGITAINADDIGLIRQVTLAGVWIADYIPKTANITVTGDTITVAGAIFGATDVIVLFTTIARVAAAGGSANAGFMIGSWNGTVVYASTTTLTLTGAYPAINHDSQVVYIKHINSTTNASAIFINGQSGVTITHAGGVLTIVGAGTPFLDTDAYEVGINALPIALDDVMNVYNVMVRNSIYDHVVDVENWAITDTTGIQRKIVYVDTYPSWCMQAEANQTGDQTGTLKAYKSNVASADTSSLTNWVDDSTGILGAGSVVFGGSGAFQQWGENNGPAASPGPKGPLKYMIELDFTAAAAVDMAYNIYIRKFY